MSEALSQSLELTARRVTMPGPVQQYVEAAANANHDWMETFFPDQLTVSEPAP
jgi:hypothetical protein